MRHFLLLMVLILSSGLLLPASVRAATIDQSLTNRLKGQILLQVEEHGEAWYVNPVDGKRYYMKDGSTAYEMMRSFGLGMTESDFTRLQNGSAELTDRLKGRIVLRVHAHGEAYYIHPTLRTIHYLKDGDAAYAVMRNLSLGITNADLSKIEARVLVIVPTTPPTGTVEGTSDDALVPSNIDLNALNIYWRDRVNGLRTPQGLRPVAIDNRFVETATEWATYMGENDTFTHTRTNGTSMHDWINTKGLDFTERNEPGGWTSNYFTENIAWGYSDNSMDGMKKMLENSITMMLAEGTSGAHYKTIYHPDWNSVGVGFYFTETTPGKYKVSVAMHYGSLE